MATTTESGAGKLHVWIYYWHVLLGVRLDILQMQIKSWLPTIYLLIMNIVHEVQRNRK